MSPALRRTAVSGNGGTLRGRHDLVRRPPADFDAAGRPRFRSAPPVVPGAGVNSPVAAYNEQPPCAVTAQSACLCYNCNRILFF